MTKKIRPSKKVTRHHYEKLARDAKKSSKNGCGLFIIIFMAVVITVSVVVVDVIA